ncbi:MAG: hypothetical protein H8D45_22070 [Bacteroidetes bacterium]|nr:hypothetical protein [Bacteroidota bacterium]
MKEKKDVKFVIYQVLYIFVVCVIALKGANLDLEEVISKENIVEKEYADSLKAFLDSILALGLVPEITFDTTKKFTNIEELKIQLSQLKTQLSVVQTSPNFQAPEIKIDPIKEEEKLEELDPETIEPLKVQALTQYTSNTITNRGSQTLSIIGSDGSTLASISPGGSQTFTLGGQSSVTYKQGNQSKTVTTKPNKAPTVTLQSLAPSGEDVSVRKIQSTTGYRVTISDDFPGQLDVNFTGPISVKQAGPLTYDVTLNFLGSKGAFERYTEGKDEPYTVGFRVTIKDRIAGHSIQRSGIFSFGEW